MQRQKSILSFFQKPSAEEDDRNATSYTELLHRSRLRQFPPRQPRPNIPPSAAEPAVPIAKDPPLPDVTGTDTPPEKARRSVFQSSFRSDDGAAPRPASAILQKLIKESGSKISRERNQANDDSFIYSNLNELDFDLGLPKQGTSFRCPPEGNASKLNKSCDQGFLDFESLPEILGPETPAMRPHVPRLKRIQEDCFNLGDSFLLDSSKRIKSVLESGIEKKTGGEASETVSSKFEWLEPSMIRDADGRRPGHALYDKRTLYIPPTVLKKMSASQKQYWSVKCQYMDVILFFKVGKFYELYELDAEIGHKELDWKITYSGVGKCRQVGISENGIDDAIQKLIARGYKVGRIEQMETSDQAKARGSTTVIQRKLVNVYTPSTTVDGNMGPNAVHLLALKEENCISENGSALYGFAFLDYATLKVWVGYICDDASCAALGALLMQVSPKEVIYESKGLSNEAHKALKKYASAGSSAMQLSPAPPGTVFIDASEVRNLIQSNGYFQRFSSSWAFALDDVMHNDVASCALGGLIGHLSRLKLDDALCNGDIRPYEVYKQCLRMDGQTLLNLEIFSNNVDGSLSGTLYKHLDNCITSSGKRLLRNWICHPLMSIGEINNRLDVVEGLMKHPEITLVIAQYLRRLPDLERLLGRVKAGVGSSVALLLPVIGEKLKKQQVKAFGSIVKGLRIGLDLITVLQKEDHGILSLSTVLNLPLLNESNGLDELLAQFEAAVDDNFPHYQDHDVKDSDAETLSNLIKLFSEKAVLWSQVIEALNCVDVLRSFAVTANSSRGSMCRPLVVPTDSSSIFSFQESGSILMITGLWHPYAVGENGGDLVPNDVYLGKDTTGNCPRTLLLTGPNMGGKSTLLRATCLAVLLAQLGCYVPCEMCVLSLVDIIFTRLGATDRIMSGESTFFVECTETASILQHATQDSLVILDELGRGTSTFDGYAIAYAVFRHLVEEVHCRLLFATHYHSLTKEFASHPRVSLQHMACAFKAKGGSSIVGEQELIFLYRLTSGSCPESYGLQVALMAGIPRKAVEAASIASQRMKNMVGENFRSSEVRSEFSTLHEGWLKTLLAVSRISDCDLDEDASDTLLLLWHELKSFHGSRKRVG